MSNSPRVKNIKVVLKVTEPTCFRYHSSSFPDEKYKDENMNMVKGRAS
jgi:hypothetical protein